MASDDITIDLNGYKDRVGQRVAPGRYKVIVDDAEADTAKSGNAMVNLWFRVLDGDFKDATIIDRLVQTPNSMFRTVGFMQASWVPTPHKTFRINLAQFRGKVLEVDVEDGEPYLGKTKSEVRGYNKVAKSAAPADLPDTGNGGGKDFSMADFEPAN